jgi:hypothetical protein
MSATTLDVIIDRVRSICVELPFEYFETDRLDDETFEAHPQGAIDGAFKVEGRSQQARGNFNYMEERTDLLTVQVARAINSDHDGVRREMTRAAHSLTAAIVRDGAEISGLYGVVDKGVIRDVTADKTHTFLMLRVTLPVNYEAQL